MPEWLEGLTRSDWLLDGSAIRSDAQREIFDGLDWDEAWVDLGPSIAGNLGPYWHVPYPPEGTVHRLYPKVLQSKWAPAIREAIRALPSPLAAREGDGE